MKQPSENMQKLYREKKESTLKKIQEAIDLIKEDNRIVTKKEILESTGLSSGTFSQEHVKLLLKENKVCQFRDRRVITTKRIEEIQQKSYEILEMENEKLLSKMQDFEIVLEHSNTKCSLLKKQYDILEQEHRLLKGKYQQLLEYLDAVGGDLSALPLI